MNYSESFIRNTAADYDMTVDQVKEIVCNSNEDGYDFYDLLENYIYERSQNY